jgi:hypothetical protein
MICMYTGLVCTHIAHARLCSDGREDYSISITYSIQPLVALACMYVVTNTCMQGLSVYWYSQGIGV